MVSTRPPTSKSSRPFNNALVTLAKAPITIGIIVTFMFHSFSIPYQGRGTYLSFHILSVLFCGQPGQKSLQFCRFSFLLIIIRYRGSVCMSKSNKSLCVSFSRTGAGLCICHLFSRSNLNFLNISQWITLITQSCLALYSFCSNLLHSLIMRFMVSSLSPHSLHLLFIIIIIIIIILLFVNFSHQCQLLVSYWILSYCKSL